MPIKQLISTIPNKPGVYQYFDDAGDIIYVGKAKDLKKRVASYFTQTHQTGKLKVLVKKIRDIRVIVTESEFDALLLENNLIKKHQPRYNILLKDDKTFPWLCIKNERFPRVIPTRNVIHDGSAYFGPYASVRMMKTILEIIKQLYQLRTCTLKLSQNEIQTGKYKVCLEYHLGNCKAPCIGKQTPEDYEDTIVQIKSIIKGNIVSVIQDLKKKMHRFAELQEFEKAQVIKVKIELLEKYKSKSTIVNPHIHDVDVLSLINDEKRAYANYLKVVNGAIVQAHTVEIIKRLNESEDELLTLALMDFRQRFDSTSREVIVPFLPEIEIPDVVFTVAQRGDKKQLLDLSERNARLYKLDRQKQRDLVDPDRHKNRILNQLKTDLHLSELPTQIECFDNSNFQGDYPVAAMVQFVNAKPNKQGYRHFIIKTVEGPNDYASMEEIIVRRYSRLMNEAKPLPQLIVVDGGKGQLSAAVKALRSINLYGKIAIIGIAKRLEEIYFPNDSVPIYLDKTSESLKIIQQLRDEAHRFGITHHRKRLEKGTIKSELTEIKGIGKRTTQKLLLELKSVKNIMTASEEDLIAVIGQAKAVMVWNHFHKTESLGNSI
ncbi:MAG: excinuclease ABC subunit C [Bacteroidetes bacterium HGW-Bacteroidetes-16]|jgi:excinuclease ABC subunit C|nr:MAG: excinuclease ABC subunit C [Bacteroidetes bacterium HGW-Bacteroidetes-16]